MTKTQFSVVVVCITALVIVFKVMPSTNFILPEAVDKARELCSAHGGITRLSINSYSNFTHKFNRIDAVCHNQIEISGLLQVKYR